MTEQELQAYIQAIAPADGAAMTAAEKRQAALAKPPGSLGALETISIRLAGITGQLCPVMNKCRVAVFAADNGVVDEGVSCAPRAVTRQQAVNMTRRVTGMSSMAACFGDEVAVVDVGMAQDPRCAAILDRHIRRTTGNIAREDAMTRQQVLDALSAGTEQAALAGRDGVTALGVGEMGIGNTTTSAAVLAVLAAVGGLDIAAMTGAFLGCAHARIPAAVDGLISAVAALCAVRLCPAAADYLFLSHDSCEPGYRLAAAELGMTPCLRLGMRLGEGSGCPLLFRVLEAACGVMRGMATFAEAAIQDDYLDEIRAADAFTVEGA